MTEVFHYGALVVSLCLSACSAERATPGVGGVPRVDGGTPPAQAAPSPAAGTPRAEGGTPVFGTPPKVDAGAPRADGGAPSADGGAPSAPDAAVGLILGSLAVSWMHGAANCAESTDPELQVHAYNATTYVIRQDKCRTFEAPFVYLLLGADTALLLDTGATNSAALRDSVSALAGARALLVLHTHAHGDHVASDNRFVGQPSTTVVGTNVGAVQAALGIDPWPTATAELDLGERVLDVLAIPGHEQTHIALYDRETGLLFTGDSLYPGLLFINDWTTYRQSIRRLAEFVASRAVSHVLGAHIEMTSTPALSYPYGTVYQPNEHVLELEAAHVMELDARLTALGPVPPAGPVALEDFVIDPQ